MSFEILKPGGASSLGTAFGYSVHSRGDGSCSLRFSISSAVMEEAGWSAATLLRLEIDTLAKQARLLVVKAGAEQARKIEVRTATGRGLFYFPHSGRAAKFFPAYEGVCELDIVKTCAGECVVFELPENLYDAEAAEAS